MLPDIVCVHEDTENINETNTKIHYARRQAFTAVRMVFDLLLYFMALVDSLVSTNAAQHPTRAKTLKCISEVFPLSDRRTRRRGNGNENFKVLR